MVSRGSGDDAPAPFILGKLRHEIDTASDFECSHWLVVLVFDVGFASQKVTQARVVDERCPRKILVDNSTGKKHIFEGWRIRRHNDLH
jgi:hypothetical protein